MDYKEYTEQLCEKGQLLIDEQTKRKMVMIMDEKEFLAYFMNAVEEEFPEIKVKYSTPIYNFNIYYHCIYLHLNRVMVTVRFGETSKKGSYIIKMKSTGKPDKFCHSDRIDLCLDHLAELFYGRKDSNKASEQKAIEALLTDIRYRLHEIKASVLHASYRWFIDLSMNNLNVNLVLDPIPSDNSDSLPEFVIRFTDNKYDGKFLSNKNRIKFLNRLEEIFKSKKS